MIRIIGVIVLFVLSSFGRIYAYDFITEDFEGGFADNDRWNVFSNFS